MKDCDCYQYPRMHDSKGVCVNWEKHDKKPCPWYHWNKEDRC